MHPYELMFIVNASEEEAVDGQIERVGRLVVDQGGQVTGVDKWGRRRFAYPIDDINEGHYVVMTFKAAAPVVDEVGRVLRLTDAILRYIVVRLDEDVVPQVASDSADEAATDTAEGEVAEAPAEEVTGEAEAADVQAEAAPVAAADTPENEPTES